MQTLHQIQALFERYLRENEFTQTPAELYEPVNYILSLGGKRLRPVFLLMAHNLFSDEIEKSLPAAFAVEVFHNFTLLHDDIMDAAPLRRGMPTVHKKYDLNAGILSGDVMLVHAYEYLMKSESPALFEVLQAFNRAATEVCQGQQMDMNFENQDQVSIEAYLKMIELKTSVLVAAAMKIGALIGGAPAEDTEFLYEFGRNLGIAFQLQDDILDTFGDPEKFGKKTGGDIAQNKKTYLFLKALEVADDGLRATLLNYYTDKNIKEDIKIQVVTELFKKLKIRSLAEAEMAGFQKIALENLLKVNVPEARKSVLKKLAHQLMVREV